MAGIKSGCSHYSDCFSCPFDECIKGRNPSTYTPKDYSQNRRKQTKHDYYVRNKEKVLERSRKWHEEHHEEYLAYMREYNAKRRAREKGAKIS